MFSSWLWDWYHQCSLAWCSLTHGPIPYGICPGGALQPARAELALSLLQFVGEMPAETYVLSSSACAWPLSFQETSASRNPVYEILSNDNWPLHLNVSRFCRRLFLGVWRWKSHVTSMTLRGVISRTGVIMPTLWSCCDIVCQVPGRVFWQRGGSQ